MKTISMPLEEYDEMVLELATTKGYLKDWTDFLSHLSDIYTKNNVKLPDGTTNAGEFLWKLYEQFLAERDESPKTGS